VADPDDDISVTTRDVVKTVVFAHDSDGLDGADFGELPPDNDNQAEGTVFGGGLFVKQDVEHIFIRFQKVVSKDHGAFRQFMARLSDAFFVPSQDDIAFIKKALGRAGLSDDDIKKKKWDFYKRRIRRHVSSPAILLRDFKRVVAMFANLEDGKTKKPFFNDKAWALYQTTVKHIKKGCLSDVEDMAYYVEIREDSFGIPIYKCLRGTSALEGFHQKIRQLIRGFNISPRYAIASLREFIYRWNHDVDVRILGLPAKYANYYDGWEIGTWNSFLSY
jgi:hypothetical protein